MRWKILGPVEVSPDVPLGRPLQRGALAYLVLNANAVVPAEQLVQALWGPAPPATATSQVYGYVSRLRRVLPAGSITGGSAGYRLVADGAEVDLARFTTLAGEARTAAPDAAAELYRSALELWRGPALAGASGDFVAPAAVRLEELRLLASEELADAELALGRHAALVARLQQLVLDNPLRERLVGQLMLALHGSGRQAEALRAYDRFRRDLADEHGLDPGASLRSLHEAIARADPDLVPAAGRPSAAPVPVVPAQLPPPVLHFTGRDAELRRLDAGTDPVVVITGTAGIGKTTLAVHWARTAAGRFPDGQLYADLRGFDPGGAAVPPAEVAAGFLEALGVRHDSIPVDAQARTGLYRSVLAGRRMLVLLDNARDADQVRPLLPGPPSVAVVTSRNTLGGLVAAQGAVPVPLSLLSPAEARELLGRRLGARLDAEPDATDELVARTARLPLALAIVAARAAVRPASSLEGLAAQLRDAGADLDQLATGDPASDVRPVLSWSYRALSAPAAELFRLLGVHPGRDIGAPAAASLLGRPRAEPLLAELVAASLLEPTENGRYGWHDLLRAYAAELAAADPGRAAALRRLVDHYVHSTFRADRRLHPQRPPITVSPAAGGVTPEDPSDAERALAWCQAEHGSLLAVHDHTVAECLHAATVELAWSLTDYLDRQGHWDSWVAVQQAAIAAATASGDVSAEATARRILATALTRLGRLADAGEELRRAAGLFERAGDLNGRAYTYLSMAFVSHRQGDDAVALAHALRVPDLYRAAGNAFDEARAWNNVGWLQAQVGEHAAALDACRRAVELFASLGDAWGQAHTWDTIGYVHSGLGEHGAAVDAYRRTLELERGSGDRHFEATVRTRLGDELAAVGDPTGARASWTLAAEILESLGMAEAAAVRARAGDR